MLERLAVPIEVTSELARPVADNIGGAKPYVTQCDVQFRYGQFELVVPADFEFDGASVPRWLWWINGLASSDDDTKLAALAHDYICEHPEVLPRVIGDAIFATLLGPILFNGRPLPGVGPKRRAAMYIAVRCWSVVSGADPLLKMN